MRDILLALLTTACAGKAETPGFYGTIIVSLIISDVVDRRLSL